MSSKGKRAGAQAVKGRNSLERSMRRAGSLLEQVAWGGVVREPSPQLSWWAGPRVGRKLPAASMPFPFPHASAEGPASSSPLCGYSAPCLPYLDAMHLPCTLVPCLALPATLLCFSAQLGFCPTAPAPQLAETLSLQGQRLPSLGPPKSPRRCLPEGRGGWNTCSGAARPREPLPAYLSLPALVLLRSWRGRGQRSHPTGLELLLCPPHCMTPCLPTLSHA